GLVYPAFTTAVAQVLFPHQANASLIVENGRIVGSELIGQSFDAPGYFWGRPSAAKYDGGASAGSNFGPLNPALVEGAQARIAALGSASSESGGIPVDLLTSSGSGLDPHISPQAARLQVTRVAAGRGLSTDQVQKLVDAHTQGRTFGV